MKQVTYLWVSHWIIHSTHFFVILILKIGVLNILYFKYTYVTLDHKTSHKGQFCEIMNK